MPTHFTYADLVDRHGESLACVYLAEIEKAAGLRPQFSSADLEARLVYALRLQDRSAQQCMAA